MQTRYSCAWRGLCALGELCAPWNLVLALWLGLAAVFPAQAQLSTLSEPCEVLPPAGWVIQNLSQPPNTFSWFRGTPNPFPAQSGTGYIAADLNSVRTQGTISTWLLTPELNLVNGSTFRFWTRTAQGSAYPDRLQVRLSTAGTSTNVGTSATDVGDFTALALEINPTLMVGGYPETWTQYTVTVTGVPSLTTGRLAFRYFVTDGGLSGSNSNYIGIDEITYQQANVPSTVTTTAATAIGATSAMLGGNVTATGSAAVTARGVIYSTTNTTPVLGGPGVTQAANGTGAGAFSATVAGLTASTAYYVRAYATNSVGTSYGAVQTFATTATAAPVVANIETATLTYTAGAPAPQITSSLTVSDADSPTLTGGTVRIATGFISTQDQLRYINQNGITGSYNTGTGILTLSGTATLATYQAALRSIQYLNTAGVNATPGTRSVSFVVSDGANTSTAQSRTIEVVQPAPAATTVTSIVRASTTNPTNASQVSFTVTFASPVTGISTSNFSVTTTGAVSGATISSLAGSGTTYTVTVNTGTGDGTLQLDLTSSTSISPTVSNVPFTGGEQYTIDKTRPAVAISSTVGASGSTTSTSPIPFTVTFPENVSGFVADDVTVTNGSITGNVVNGTSPGTTYTFTVTPATAGTATTVDVPANVAQDAAGNLNTAATLFSITYAPPVPVLQAPSGTPVGLGQALTLTGSDLSSPTALTINGADALSGIISNTGSRLVVRVPMTAAASGTIRLSTANSTSNSVAFQVLAAPGNALAFDGTNDAVSIPSAPALDLTTAFTIEAWINPVGTGVATQNVVCKSSRTQNTGYIFPRTDDTWASVRLWLHRGGGWSQYTIPYGPSKLGRWHHLAATYDGTTVRLYLDGEEVPNVATGTIRTGAVTTNTNPLTLGSQPGYTEFYRGGLDEVRVYNTVRTAAQIQNDMRTVPAGLPEAGLVEYLNFDQGTPATASTGNNTGLTTLYDLASAQPATLTGFALASGNTTSNYVGSLALVVPTATVASNRQPNSFTATWTAPAVGTVTSYVLDVATNATFTAPVAGSPFTVAAPAISYTVTGLPNTASTYYYRVRALVAPLADEGTFSNTITTATPLPVELTAFTATATATATGPQAVRLAWTTATEVNSASFGVERSLDGVTFRPVGTVPAAGTSQAPRAYTLLDQQLPAGVPVLYYRLQQLDQDGTFSYSPVRAVALSNAAPTRLTLAPNPTTGAATLRGAAAHAPVQLYDAVGRLVLTATADATGTAHLVLPAGQPLGVYVVRTGAQATRLVLE